MNSMKERGIGMLYGRWLIEGAPRVLLLDTKTGYQYMNEWKADLWNLSSIPSPPNDDETNEAIVFGYLVAWFLGEVSDAPLPQPRLYPCCVRVCVLVRCLFFPTPVRLP